MNRASLKAMLERLYISYPFAERVKHDPIRFPLSYKAAPDREAVGFISACLAYGRVALFSAVLERLFRAMGEHPHEFIASFNPRRDAKKLGGAKYRFQSADDIAALIYITGEMLRRRGTLEAAFTRHMRPDDEDTGAMIAGFVDEALGVDTSAVYGGKGRPLGLPPGLRQMLPSPATGGASKRMCLYLRWMVRRADIDMGLWRSVSPSKLVIPLDTHIGRIGRCLSLTSRASNDWKTALEITASLRALDPADPLKYDFALCHMGISGECSAARCACCKLTSEGCKITKARA